MPAEFTFGSDTNLRHFTDAIEEAGGTVRETDRVRRRCQAEGIDRNQIVELAEANGGRVEWT